MHASQRAAGSSADIPIICCTGPRIRHHIQLKSVKVKHCLLHDKAIVPHRLHTLPYTISTSAHPRGNSTVVHSPVHPPLLHSHVQPIVYAKIYITSSQLCSHNQNLAISLGDHGHLEPYCPCTARELCASGFCCTLCPVACQSRRAPPVP